MKILFLHGWQSTPGGVKPTYLAHQGHEVLNPALPDDDFDAAIRIAQAEFDRGRPDVVVGSSRGGAVAMNIDSGATPLVLLCPAWKRWGTAKKVKPSTVILHSPVDETIPFSESQELLRNSGLPLDPLISVGSDHRLADPASLQALLWACGFLATKTPPSWLAEEHSPLKQVPCDANSTAFLDKVRTQIVPWIEQATIPFFHLRKDPTTNEYGIIGKDRTGVFLRVGRHYFILTASHGISEAVDSKTYLFMSWDDEEKCPIPIAQDQIAITDPATFDIAVVKLTDANAKALLRRHRPISVADTVRDCRNSTGLFLVVGYPRAGTEFVEQKALEELHEPDLESLKVICKRTRTGWGRSELKYSPLIHVVVGMSRQAVSKATGMNALLPDHGDIQGISGCGIWQIADRAAGKPLDAIGIDDCKIIAIEHSYDEAAGRVAGTWIDVALEVMAVNFPETRAPMKLVYPK